MCVVIVSLLQVIHENKSKCEDEIDQHKKKKKKCMYDELHWRKRKYIV